MGVEIKGNRLGLGTNLFSSQQTLSERVGIEKEEKELKRKSKMLIKAARIDKSKIQKETVENRVEIKVGKYHPEEQTLEIKVKNVDEDKGIQSIMAAMWKAEDQSDLQWIPLAIYNKGVCKAKIDMGIFDSVEGMYNIHVYVVDGDGEQYNVAETQMEIK